MNKQLANLNINGLFGYPMNMLFPGGIFPNKTSAFLYVYRSPWNIEIIHAVLKGEGTLQV